uniref:Secreted protein n=1 Tax=Ficedula albicollis TaxID=59894 RepID=A0A803VQF8_FICAL
MSWDFSVILGLFFSGVCCHTSPLPFPPADPSVSPVSPSPWLPALLCDGFLPQELSGHVVATDLVPNGGWISTSSWCCWNPSPSAGSPPAARWSTSAWSSL